MDQKQLKNNLDQINHRFDKEALWNKIQQPKKRRRNIWIWICISLGFLAAYGVYQQNDMAVTLSNGFVEDRPLNENASNFNTPVTSINIDTTQISQYQADTDLTSITEEKDASTRGKIPMLSNTNHSKDQNPSHQTKNQISNTNAVSNKAQMKPSGDLLASHQQKVSTTQNADISEENNTPIPNTTTSTTSRNAEEKVENDVEQAVLFKHKFENISLLPRLTFRLQNQAHHTWALSPNNRKHRKPVVKRQTIFASASYGQDFHCFGDNENGKIRSDQEKNLESWGVHVQYQYQIKNRLALWGKGSFVQSQTQVQNEESSVSFTNIGGSVLRSWERTLYDVFNEYRRVDLSLGLVYDVDLGKQWLLAPSLGLGYNIMSSASGRYWNVENELTLLENDADYRSNTGFFSLASISLKRHLKQRYVYGITLAAQSGRSLNQDDINKHTILPTEISLFFGKMF